MTRKMLEVLDSTASKNDEIEWLCRVRECAGKGTYVEHLFSDKLMYWVKQRIFEDMSPDVVDWWEGVNETTMFTGEQKAKALVAELDRHKTENFTLAEQLRQTQQTNRERTTTLEGARQAIEGYQDEIERLKSRMLALSVSNQTLGNEVFELRAERKAIGNFLREALGMKELDTKEV